MPRKKKPSTPSPSLNPDESHIAEIQKNIRSLTTVDDRTSSDADSKAWSRRTSETESKRDSEGQKEQLKKTDVDSLATDVVDSRRMSSDSLVYEPDVMSTTRFSAVAAPRTRRTFGMSEAGSFDSKRLKEAVADLVKNTTGQRRKAKLPGAARRRTSVHFANTSGSLGSADGAVDSDEALKRKLFVRHGPPVADPTLVRFLDVGRNEALMDLMRQIEHDKAEATFKQITLYNNDVSEESSLNNEVVWGDVCAWVSPSAFVVGQQDGRKQCRKCILDSDVRLIDAPSPTRKSGDNTETLILSFTKFYPYSQLYQAVDQGAVKFQLDWKILNHSDSYTIRVHSRHFNTSLDYVRSYPFRMTRFLYLYLTRCPIHLELYASDDKGNAINNQIIATCTLNIHTALEHVNRTYENELELNNKELLAFAKDKQGRQERYAALVCRYTVTGDVQRINECRAGKLEHVEATTAPLVKCESNPSLQTMQESASHRSTFGDKEVNQSALANFQESLSLVLMRNKALRTTQEEVSTELAERTRWMHEELIWRLTLQEHAILCCRDPHTVKWRQWKDELTAKVRYRPNIDFEFKNAARLEIVLEQLQLNPFGSIAADDTVTRIYLEYTFLQHTGRGMETRSVPKTDDSTPIVYNFRRRFILQKTSRDAKLFADMIRNNESIVVYVVSEPIDEQDQLQTSWEVGVCHINILEMLHYLTDKMTKVFSVKDDVTDEEIGTLTVTFNGLFSLRSLALYMLAPDDFNIVR